MADVFVSYSRRDSDFVARLSAALHDRGKEVWVDTAGIRDAEVFPAALRTAIESSDGFVFVITPDSVASTFCVEEVDHALELNKRIVPLACRPVEDDRIPEGIRVRNWIPIGPPDFASGVDRLVRALDTDLDFAKQHTRWLLKALEWDQESRERSFLLRGAELTAAEHWLASAAGKDPAPTALQQDYVFASRASAARRQRVFAGVSLVVAAISISLLVLALIARGQAVSERTSARAQALAAQSQAQLPNDPEISLILGMRAVTTKTTPETLLALRSALDASPLERGLPTISNPGQCGVNYGLFAAYSPDDGQLAEGACNGMLRLLDARSGTLQHAQRLGSGVASVAYSPDGSTLAAATVDGVVLIDPETGRVTRRLAQGAYASSLAFTADGRELAADDQVGITVWTLPDGGARVLTREQSNAGTMAFTSDQRQLIVGAQDSSVHIYDVATGRLLHRIVAPHESVWEEVVALSADGKHLAVGYPIYPQDATGRVSVYSTTTWRKEVDVMTDPGVQISAVAFSPDGTRLAIGGEDGTAGLWSVATGQQLASFDGATAAVGSVQFTHDGRSVLTASNDGIARVWRASGAESSYATIPNTVAANQVALFDGRVEVTPFSGGVVYSTPVGGGSVRTLQLGSAGAATLSPDGRFAVSHGAYGVHAPMAVWSMATGKVVRTLPAATYINAVFSRDDSRLLLQLPAAANAVHLTVITLATGHSVQLQLPNSGCGSPAASVAFSRDDRLVAGDYFCGTAVVWNAETGRIVRTVDEGGEISAVDLSSDGTRLLVSSWDSRATIWSVATGRPLVKLIGHTRGIAGAAFTPNATTVVTTSLDKSVRVWDATTGHVLRVLPFPDLQGVIGFSSDGALLMTVDGEVPPGTPLAVRVFQTCPDCQDGPALLKLAAPGVTTNLTQLESAVVGRQN
jgi:WD40 repeat protein